MSVFLKNIIIKKKYKNIAFFVKINLLRFDLIRIIRGRIKHEISNFY